MYHKLIPMNREENRIKKVKEAFQYEDELGSIVDNIVENTIVDQLKLLECTRYCPSPEAVDHYLLDKDYKDYLFDNDNENDSVVFNELYAEKLPLIFEKNISSRLALIVEYFQRVNLSKRRYIKNHAVVKELFDIVSSRGTNDLNAGNWTSRIKTLQFKNTIEINETENKKSATNKDRWDSDDAKQSEDLLISINRKEVKSLLDILSYLARSSHTTYDRTDNKKQFVIMALGIVNASMGVANPKDLKNATPVGTTVDVRIYQSLEDGVCQIIDNQYRGGPVPYKLSYLEPPNMFMCCDNLKLLTQYYKCEKRFNHFGYISLLNSVALDVNLLLNNNVDKISPNSVYPRAAYWRY